MVKAKQTNLPKFCHGFLDGRFFLLNLLNLIKKVISHIFYTNLFRIFYCNNKKQSPQEVILNHYQWNLISIRLEKHKLLVLSSKKKNGWFLFVKDSMQYTLNEKKNRPPLVQDYFSWLSTEFSPLTLKEASKGNLHVEL